MWNTGQIVEKSAVLENHPILLKSKRLNNLEFEKKKTTLKDKGI